jgi:hypothetical protein
MYVKVLECLLFSIHLKNLSSKGQRIRKKINKNLGEFLLEVVVECIKIQKFNNISSGLHYYFCNWLPCLVPF